MIEEAHLGDRILLEGELCLTHIETLYSNGLATEPEDEDNGDF
jgi:hypothetical protein